MRNRVLAGYTLIEILVVIAVVGILAAILVPTFLSVRERGRSATCVSNEHQLALAILQYAADNDDAAPGVHHISNTWGGLIYPYVHATGIYQCPDDGTKSASPYSIVSYAVNSNLHYLSKAGRGASKTVMLFEINGDTAIVTQRDEGEAPGKIPQSMTVVGDGVSQLALMGCCNASGKPFSIDTNVTYATGPIGGRGDSKERHSGGSNFALCDGHVHWFLPTQVSSGADASSPTNNQDVSCKTTTCAAGSENASYEATFSTE